MDFRPTDEQELLRRSVREFAETEMRPHVGEWDEAQHFPTELIPRLAELGLMGMQFPEQYGGAGLSAVDYCICIEELARVDPAVSLSVAAHNGLCASHLGLFGSEAQKRRYLAPLVRGERVTFHGEFTNVEDAVLLPAPRSPIPMMIGSNGPRMLAITVGTVDAWNTWYASYGNDPVKFAALNAEITAAARAAGRDPATLRRSACVLVRTDPASTERPLGEELPPVEGSSAEIVAKLAAYAAAGADEIIVIANPINERSVREIGALLPALRATVNAANGAHGANRANGAR